MRNSGEGPRVTPIRVASFVTIAVFLALAGRLFSLQIVRGDYYVEQSKRNYIVRVSIKAPRGDIVDREGQVLAGSRQSFSICGVPRLLLRNGEEMDALGAILVMDREEIRLRLKASAMSFRPTAIVRDVDFATVSRVEEDFAELPDVLVVSEPVRYYPEGQYFGHLVGYVGEVTQQEITAGQGRYGAGDLVGRAGIEKTYEKYLAGKDGVKFMKFSVTGGASPADMSDLPEAGPQPGMRAVLYADAGLQRIAETMLIGLRGSVTAIDVRTGGVLVLASSPAYDPSLFATGISSADWSALVEGEDRPLLNRAIQCAYPPGSTYKIVTAGAALEARVVGEGSTMGACAGAMRFGNRVFSCWNKGGHGTRDLVGAITVSCDVYFYQLGERLGLDRFSAASERWHLNEPTGIDLPGEIRGTVPSRSYYDSRYGKNNWSKGLMVNLAIGQGEMLVTPIEMLTFVCGVAGWGRYYEPACLARIESSDGVYVPARRPLALSMSRSTLDILRRAMLAVCESPEGTGKGARLEGINVAGKTGTAQNPHGNDHAWFVCFAPYENPEIAICVMLENGGHGGAVGAPIARRIMEHYFHLDQEELPDSMAAPVQAVVAGD
jgi:penicillin-binding protein 2